MTFNEIEKEFDEKFKCIQSDCDGHGNIPKLVCGMRQISDTECEQTQEWEAEQCQFHAEYIFPIKSFLKQSFIKCLQVQIEILKDTTIESNNIDFVNGFVRANNENILDLQAQIKLLEV